MANEERYFDNAATTPLDPRVLDAMLPFLREGFGNANSIHNWGTKAREAVERARLQVAELIHAEDPSQLFFTSGATEANNWVAKDIASGGVLSPFEHSSMIEAALANGWTLASNKGLTIELEDQKDVSALSLMSVNNEIGTRWDIRQLATDRPVRRHSDITQQVGKLPTDVQGLDWATMSAHKFYGPKGVGALFAESAHPLPLILGGGQELGARAGTLNVPAIVGMGAASQIAADEIEENLAHVAKLRGIVLDELRGLVDWRVNGGDDVSPYILSISFLGIQGETIVIEADRAGFAISAGAACSSGSTEPSRVLVALGLSTDWQRGTVRISFGRQNSDDSARELGRILRTTAKNLRRMG